MGLSASQARLLTLTARLSDLELRAQQISNSKIRLSQDSEAASTAYSEALSKEKLTMKTADSDGNTSYSELTANMLINYDSSSLESQRMLKDGYGRILVSDKEASAFSSSGGSLETFINKFGYTNYTAAQLESKYQTNFNTSTLTSAANSEASILNSISNSVSVTTTTNVFDTTTYQTTGGLSSSVSSFYSSLVSDINTAMSTNSSASADAVGTDLGEIKETFYSNSSYQSILATDMSYAAHASEYYTQGQASAGDSALSNIDTDQIYGMLHEYYPGDTTTGTTVTTNTTVADVSTTTYSSTLTKDNMATELNNLYSTLSNISATCTSSDLTTYLNNNLSKLTTAIAEVNADGSTLSSGTVQNVGVLTASVNLDTLSNLLSASSLTSAAKATAVGDYTYDSAAISYYQNVFKAMKDGYVTTSSSNLSSNQWLYDQLKMGTLTLYKYDKEGGSDGAGGFESESISEDSALVEKTDDTQTAQAEATYEEKTAEIQTKDQKFDLELSNIDTEHTAVQTELDSVKKVVDKNIDRNFKLFNA